MAFDGLDHKWSEHGHPRHEFGSANDECQLHLRRESCNASAVVNLHSNKIKKWCNVSFPNFYGPHPTHRRFWLQKNGKEMIIPSN